MRREHIFTQHLVARYMVLLCFSHCMLNCAAVYFEGVTALGIHADSADIMKLDTVAPWDMAQCQYLLAKVAKPVVVHHASGHLVH